MNYLQPIIDLLGTENVLTSRSECVAYSRDMSVHQAVPDLVVFVNNTQQVSEVMKIASKFKVPIVARGAGSSVTGAALASKGGIVINMRRMNNIKQINLEDGYVVVEPGVVCATLNKTVMPSHFFPPDPGSAPIATIGGMASTNASGVRAVKYGTTRDYIMGMEVVLADGTILRTGTKAPKSSSGYDLTRLFCTSEGTLGVITELTVRILPKPEFSAFGQLHFKTAAEAGACVRQLFAEGVPISTCEILDGCCIDAVKKSMGLNIADEVNCLLFMELDGEESSVNKAVGYISKVMKEHGGLMNDWASDPAKREAIWSARHGLVASLNRLNPGRKQVPLMEDFGVPMSKIPETIADIQAIGKKYGMEIATFGHIGDGNLHPVLIIDPYSEEEWQKVHDIANEFVELTLKYEGTLTAEHGIGMAKSPLISREIGDVGVKVMQAIKDALDPNDILNPGKLGLKGSPKDIFEQRSFDNLVGNSGCNANTFSIDVDNEILACSQCGFCSMNCPTYANTGNEALSARGRHNLSFGMLTGTEAISEEMAKKMYQCTMCDNCTALCPAGVKTSTVVQATRQKLYEQGLAPQEFNVAFKSMIENGNPFMELPEKRTDNLSDLPDITAETEVIYWPGCVSSYQELKVAPSVIKILNNAGIKWATLKEKEGCCGYLSYVAGATDVLKTLIEKNTSIFGEIKGKTIITSCPGCLKAFRDIYPKYSHMKLEAYHTVEYFEKLIVEGKLSFIADGKPMTVTYHDPCDLGRHLGVYEPPRNILNAIPAVELIEFSNNRQRAKCCGSGGGLKAHDLDLSGKLGDSRIQEAGELGVDTIVSACASCKQSLTHASARLKKNKLVDKKIKVVDLMEIMANNIR
jgi:glycolate oxidase subunit GlcD